VYSYFFVTPTADFILLPLFRAPLLPEQVSDVDVKERERERGGGDEGRPVRLV